MADTVSGTQNTMNEARTPFRFLQVQTMTKREMIDQIRRFNPTAQPDFLADFQEKDLLAYLHQVSEVERERREHKSPEIVPA